MSLSFAEIALGSMPMESVNGAEGGTDRGVLWM
jgi:hypothetical protein